MTVKHCKIQGAVDAAGRILRGPPRFPTLIPRMANMVQNHARGHMISHGKRDFAEIIKVTYKLTWT